MISMFNNRHSLFGIALVTVLAGCTSALSQQPPATPAPAAQAEPTAAAPTATAPAAQAEPPATAPPATAPPARVAPRDERRPTQTSRSSTAARAAADRALSDLAQKLGISQTSIEVLGVQPHYDAPSRAGDAGQLAGWNIRLGVGQDVYLYQVDARGALKQLPTRP
jgi:hypothetical protein